VPTKTRGKTRTLRPQPAKKTAAKTAAVQLVPQPHGGALATGGIPGNAGGGRPPSIVRERCRRGFDRRIPVLEAIADGEPVQKMRLPDGEELEAVVSASPADRIRAMDVLGRYGLATGRLDLEDVRLRLARTLQRITEVCDPETAESLLTALEQMWDPPARLVLEK
jgi:hypothetical protein